MLICEDLARQDPVSELLRSVGPNLILALLLDGPQITARWPGRYATVLADDPGSSVLTLSSIGMVSSMRVPKGMTASRSVGLWKDAGSGESHALELEKDADSLLIKLGRVDIEEWTADQRGDNGTTGYLKLYDCIQIRVDK